MRIATTGILASGSGSFDLMGLSGLVSRHEFSDPTSITTESGNRIINVADKKNGYPFIWGTGAAQRPTYINDGSGVSGKAFAKTPSGQYFLRQPVGGITTTPFASYLVVKLPTLVLDGKIMYFSFVGVDLHLEIPSPTGTGMRVYKSSALNYSTPVKAALRTTAQLIKVYVDSNNLFGIEINKEPTVLQLTGAAGTHNTTYERMQLSYLDAEYYDLINFSRNPTGAENDNIKDALITQYGLVSPAKLMIAFGDSHVMGSMAGTPTGTPYMTQYDATTVKYYNLGVSGTVVRQQGSGQGVPNNLIDHYVNYNLNKFSNCWVSFQYGTNDCANFAGDAGDWTDWKADYKAIIQTFITAGFAANKIIICTPPYSTASYVAGQLTTCATKITEIASELGIQLADFRAAHITATQDIQTISGGDGIHMNGPMHTTCYNTISAITGT